MDPTAVAANRRQQQELYGAPLGTIVHALTVDLSLSQSGLAQVLGLSAPMLSQLASGQRIKISNPQAVARLQALMALGREASRLPAAEVAARVAEIAARNDTLTTLTTDSAERNDPAAILARLDSQDALIAAAAAAAPHSAAVAAALREAAARHG